VRFGQEIRLLTSAATKIPAIFRHALKVALVTHFPDKFGGARILSRI